MKNIFKAQTINELADRIEQITMNSTPQWGKMNVYQMLKHCTENEKLMLREATYKRRFIGRIFGKMALKSSIKDEAPLARNSPTHPALKFTGNGDVEQQKKEWLEVLVKYPTKKATDYKDFVHPFFGKMESEQISRLAYKHIDHHLRQFGV